MLLQMFIALSFNINTSLLKISHPYAELFINRNERDQIYCDHVRHKPSDIKGVLILSQTTTFFFFLNSTMYVVLCLNQAVL